MNGYNGLTIPQWMRNPQKFQCIRELKFFQCSRCKDLPIIWLSPSLEKLRLSHMDNLTTLCKNIDVEAAGSNNSTMQVFPKLKKLELINLPELERWVENSVWGHISLVIFPKLDKLNIHQCPKLANLPQAPLLTSLSCVREYAHDLVVVNIPLGSWPSLVHLEIGVLADILIPLEDQQSQRPLETLRSLEVASDDGFASVFSSEVQPGLRDCLVFVEYLEISCCDNIVQWPVEVLRCLPRLQHLSIMFCKNLEGDESSSEEILLLSQLEILWIQGCDCLLKIPMLPASLKSMGINSCKSLVALPDGMDGFSSLERLRIHLCPRIEEFPQGILQRLPALNDLSILGCPELQRRCREGGEYFDLVSSIRKKDIPFPATTWSTKKKFVKKLLPSC
ncbi:hypothetical protein QOZ80_8BG0667770 [Eleusine coracana subsp. coracana]|nr:hypothetical protein QOZ80_8BG0667770 [Eleusine coracana subsp. coracana]